MLGSICRAPVGEEVFFLAPVYAPHDKAGETEGGSTLPAPSASAAGSPGARVNMGSLMSRVNRCKSHTSLSTRVDDIQTTGG